MKKYYVYAGYYENFISGHKLPKPYILRDTFKTFDEALDYILENWEDEAIYYTEDVIDEAIDSGYIPNDESWSDFLLNESKKSMKESISTEVGAYLQGKIKQLTYCIADLKDRPSKRNANDVLRVAIDVKEFCESYIRELENAIKNDEF